MNRFSADYSSSPPSTPNATGKQPLRNPLFEGISGHPSTTPAGLPPSSAASFTPAGPPPSTAFGSSRLGSKVSKLQFSKDSVSSAPINYPPLPGPAELPPRTKNGTPSKPRSQGFQVPDSSFASSNGPLRQVAVQSIDEEDDEEYDETMDEDEAEYDDEVDDVMYSRFTGINSTSVRRPQPASSLPQFVTQSSRKSQKRPKKPESRRPARLTHLPYKGRYELIPGIARDMIARSARASLNESDDIILNTEAAMKELHEEVLEAKNEDDNIQAVVSHYAHDLIRLWGHHAKNDSDQGESTGIGPPPLASAFQKANYVASLLLALYHPPSYNDASPEPKLSNSKSISVVPVSSGETMPLPQIILDWLDNYHVSYQALFETVQSASPDCTAHPLFWDAVHSLMLRGKTREVGQLFAEADFKYAASAVDEGAETPGYRGAQLQAVQSLIYRAGQVLESCPGTKYADWQTDSAEWDLYRRRVLAEMEHLMDFTGEEDDDADGEPFQARNFGIHSKDTGFLGRSIRKSANSLPTTIFENLKIMYRILLGSSEEILAQSQDWLEATTSLTIWWDGTQDDDIEKWSLNVSHAQAPSQANDACLARLRNAFLCSTDPDASHSFQMNTISPMEIGIGLILQGDNENAVALLQTFSLCISSALIELGSLAGWMSSGSSQKTSGLNQDDLMVLSYGASNTNFKKDDILHAYAEALFDREELIPGNGLPVEGWEISLSLASRFDDQQLARTTISEILDQLQLQDQGRVDKLVSLCYELGLEEDSRKVSEKFADHLLNNTTDYGTALLCYARSHASNKIRQVIDLLISYCLVQSRSYPTDEEMDQDLRRLVESPKIALAGLADVDPEAAEILQFYLAGYSCLRKFYALRDDDIVSTKAKSSMRPIARKMLAARTLVAAIRSAADSIYGGLYDPERQSAIQVDGLLTLLGEATAFLATEANKRNFSSDQMYALLAAIEDLQTVNTRVYDAAEECLQAALRNFNGSLPPSPHAMLKKSVSSGTNSNFSFSMMGSEMLARSGESGGGKSIGSMAIIGASAEGDAERGWDWRAQFKDNASTGADVLRCLRFGVAQELSMAEFEN